MRLTNTDTLAGFDAERYVAQDLRSVWRIARRQLFDNKLATAWPMCRWLSGFRRLLLLLDVNILLNSLEADSKELD
jgi:hypothetical protein